MILATYFHARIILNDETNTYPDTYKKAMTALYRYSSYATNYQDSEESYNRDYEVTEAYVGTVAEGGFPFKYGEKTVTLPVGSKVLFCFANTHWIEGEEEELLYFAFVDENDEIIADSDNDDEQLISQLKFSDCEFTTTGNDDFKTYSVTSLGDDGFTFSIKTDGDTKLFTQAEDSTSATGITIDSTTYSWKRILSITEEGF